MKLKIEKGIPYTPKVSKELSNALLELKHGDSVFLSYDEFTRTTITNSIASARVRIVAKGLTLKSISDDHGRRVWAIKEDVKN